MSEWDPIPGETPFDPSDLKDKSIRTRAELNRAEALSIAKAAAKYLGRKPTKATAPFTQSWLLKLHKEMFQDVLISAGRQRQVELNIGVPWPLIPDRLENMLQDLFYWEQHGTYCPIEQAVRLHWAAAAIHPFNNGNGRWARMLANIWLLKHGEPIVNWPDEDLVGTASSVRAEYITAIHEADWGDFEHLLRLHRKYAE